MAASAISGICNFASSTLPNHRERDPRKASVREHDVLLNRTLKHGRSCEATPKLVHHLEQFPHSDVNQDDRNCSCGMDSASSQSVSARRVLLAVHTDSPPISYRKLQKKLSIKKVGKKSIIRVSTLPCPRSRDPSASFQKVAKQRHQRQVESSEKWGTDRHVDDATEEVSRRQKRRAALAALAVAGYVSILQPSSASATEAFRADFPAPTTTVEALEAQFKGSTRNELESEIQIHRNESEMTTAPSLTQTQDSQNIASTSTLEMGRVGGSRLVQEVESRLVQEVKEDSFYAWRQLQKEIDMEADPFYAWEQATKEIRIEDGLTLQDIENDSFYAWKQVLKEAGIVPPPPAPKSPVKKAVAASVAVAVAGSVAGAASAAGRAVVSSGGNSAVATSLTVLQHSALPGSTLLAKIAQHLGGGGVAGALGATVVYPLDTIKTRMQAQNLVCGCWP